MAAHRNVPAKLARRRRRLRVPARHALPSSPLLPWAAYRMNLYRLCGSPICHCLPCSRSGGGTSSGPSVLLAGERGAPGGPGMLPGRRGKRVAKGCGLVEQLPSCVRRRRSHWRPYARFPTRESGRCYSSVETRNGEGATGLRKTATRCWQAGSRLLFQVCSIAASSYAGLAARSKLPEPALAEPQSWPQVSSSSGADDEMTAIPGCLIGPTLLQRRSSGAGPQAPSPTAPSRPATRRRPLTLPQAASDGACGMHAQRQGSRRRRRCHRR